MQHRTKLPPVGTSLEEWAIFYASLQFPIIPLYEPNIHGECSCANTKCSSIGKHPRVKHGLNDATTEIKKIQAWWKKWPNANIGLITGQSSGKIVIDIDPKNGGFESLQSMKEQYGSLFGTSVKSGGQGLHFYFDNPSANNVSNKVNVLPGVDVRGNGGYIIAPPSKHMSGHFYEWLEEAIDSNPIPDWLLNLIVHIPHKSPAKTENSDHIGPGSRNMFLASIAGTLKKYGLNYNSALEFLNSINHEICMPALNSEEVSSIALSISHYECRNEGALTWIPPTSIPNMSYETPSMDPSYIPEALQEWIIDIATRMQVPCEFISVPTIVALSSLIGRKIRIYPKKLDNWLVVPNLWGAIVARPGMFKSPAIAEALSPLEAIVTKENTTFSEKTKIWGTEQSILSATADAVKDQLIRCIKRNNIEEADTLKERLKTITTELSDNKPTCKRLKTNDATVEKIVDLLLENPNGLLVTRDELSGWLASLNKPGRDGDRSMFLESWNGYGSYTMDRIGRGTTHVSSLCLSVFGGIQPDKLDKLITSTLDTDDDGLLQRFQVLIYPEIKGKWKNYDVSPNMEAHNKVVKIFNNIHNFAPCSSNSFIGLHFDNDAQVIFDSWREKLEETLRSNTINNCHFEGHVAKYRSLIPSLSLIFELLNNQDCSHNTQVHSPALLLAIKWSEYLLEHAKKIYKVHDYPYLLSIEAFQKKILALKIRDGDSVRSIGRHCWEHLRTPEEIENTLSFFVEKHWIQILESSAMGRPSRFIKLNPSLLSNI